MTFEAVRGVIAVVVINVIDVIGVAVNGVAVIVVAANGVAVNGVVAFIGVVVVIAVVAA